MSAGRLIAVVGPSGVGKDSVMRALVAAKPGMHLVRRVITRPSEAGGEDFEGVTEGEFAARDGAGAFALSWPAHGLHYGIPRAVEQVLAEGHDAVVNLSRAVLPRAQARFPGLVVISLTADAGTLAERLAARGREDREEIARRLARATFALPDGIDAVEIDNTGPLDDTVDCILAHLMPAKV
ncbi:phosphonate metabolism protein/1,5-bisphosphokinase (PRPP-forming) PhnN [Pseudooceanicola sp. LIPI14-2-Ac024]|uniref:phosphonate metabolism protein/1,5-bisphosphokinase (PRPP-forming) PhnN n=1 Tax=Pseudooceanicola sp. LIPI14-2-Ac024 TaxID=3344875 RepID=UPI0035CF3C59